MKKNSKVFKQMQRERIYKTKPWLKSTGPKSAKGKDRSKMNALKISPELYTLLQEYKQIMQNQKLIKHYLNF